MNFGHKILPYLGVKLSARSSVFLLVHTNVRYLQHICALTI